MAMTTIKTNHHIGQQGAQTLYYAAEVARFIHLPLNHFITINYRETSIPLLEVRDNFSKLLAHINRWMRSSTKHKASFIPTYFWVFENCSYGIGRAAKKDVHNLHVHWIMHIPEGYEEDVLFQVKSYLMKRTSINERTVHLADTDKNANLSYFMKSCKPEYIHMYGRGQKASDQGEVPGERRVSASRNINKSARKAMDEELGVKRTLPY